MATKKLNIGTTERLEIAFEAALEMDALMHSLRPMLTRAVFQGYPDKVVVLALMDRVKIVTQVAFDAGNAGEDEHHDPLALWAALRAPPTQEARS